MMQVLQELLMKSKLEGRCLGNEQAGVHCVGFGFRA